MPYPVHQPISISGGQALGSPVRRDGVFVDQERDRADVPIVDERVPFDTATHVSTEAPVASPWPFNPATTKWRLRNTIRAKTQAELDEAAKAASRTDLNKGVLQMAQILITLVDKLIQKGTITANDFDPATRAMYVAFKANVDRLR